MAKALDFQLQAENTSAFDTVIPRKYAPCQFHRVFETGERWYTVSGSAELTDAFNGKTYKLEAGSCLICPVNSAIHNINIKNEWVVKQLVLESIPDATNRRINVQINWMIIQTILEILDEYRAFTSVPHETEELFRRAKEGELYQFDEYTNFVDTCIANFVSRSGISADVWFGKRRLLTGLKYTGPHAKRIEGDMHIDVSSAETGTVDRLSKVEYADLLRNPLNLPEADEFLEMLSSGMYSLRSLLRILIVSIMTDKNMEIKSEYKLKWQLRIPSLPNGCKPHLGAHGLPKQIVYGTRLRTMIEKLISSNMGTPQLIG